MTTEHQQPPTRRFAPAVLPWLILGAALLTYLLLLNHWVLVINLADASGISGLSWQPNITRPIYYLVTLPFHWLSPAAVPVALNVFAAMCAAAVLAFLARSVAILPQNRTQPQRDRQGGHLGVLTAPWAWVPPVAAVLICGFQLTFLENATSSSGEMFDLLIFAFVIWSLLEYRVDGREWRLFLVALVYGLGMSNNWAMVGFFPLFIGALVWLRGFSFFNLTFLGLMFLSGLLGSLFILLLPALTAGSHSVHISFWEALKFELSTYKSPLVEYPKKELLLLALTSVIPLFVISIRWKAFYGDISRLGIGIATATFHFVHGIFLVVCCWVAFDPTFSPRFKGYGLGFLTFYYVGALCVGYCVGYFLLVFIKPPFRPRRLSANAILVNRIVTTVVLCFLVGTAFGLAYRNLPQIRLNNSPVFREYVDLVNESLPKQGNAVVVSDDVLRGRFFDLGNLKSPSGRELAVIETPFLDMVDYHNYLHARYPSFWPAPPAIPPGRAVPADVNVAGLLAASSNAPMFYLHPSFGYFFEQYYLEPHGLVYQLRLYSTNQLLPPPLSREIISANETFWAALAENVFPAMIRASHPPEGRDVISRIFQHLGLTERPNANSARLASFYSRGLTYWGAQLQSAGDFSTAARHFSQALELNPENVVAQVNLTFNKQLVAGATNSVLLSKAIEDQFGKYRSWDQVLAENGPFEEPNFCYEQGNLYLKNRLFRQAAAQFSRTRALSPDHAAARFWLAHICLIARMPGQAQEVLADFNSPRTAQSLNATNRAEFLYLQTSAYLQQNNPAVAEANVKKAMNAYPGDENLPAVGVSAFSEQGYFTNALAVVDLQLQRAPGDIAALVNKGYLYIQLEKFDPAVTWLTRALNVQTNNDRALFNRAIAYLRSERLAEAESDYLRLEKIYPKSWPVQYGLGEIAYRRHETNEAVLRFQNYLANANTNTAESQSVIKRLAELRPGSN